MALQLPTELKALQQYIRTAQEFSKRDPIVTYFCWLYAVQEGIRLGGTKTPNGKAALTQLMNDLEKLKEVLVKKFEEAVTNDEIAQTYLEEKGDQLFSYADTEDRASRFGKNVIKAFYTASTLYTILEQFGELSPEMARKRKYAKWKATYINTCLKNGETPQPGPIGSDQEFDDFLSSEPSAAAAAAAGAAAASNQPSGSIGFQNFVPPPHQPDPQQNPYPAGPPAPGAFAYAPPPSSATAVNPSPPSGQGATSQLPAAAASAAPLQGLPYNLERHQRVEKLCRFVVSSLNYEDVDEAVKNLRKALNVLTTGREEG